MNILFSTTRHWNPGDELINRGIAQLLRLSGFRFNTIVWNRHPSIRPSHTSLDNSFDEFRHDPQSIDYVIFAGTPEWLGDRVDPLYQLIQRNGIRCSLIGLRGHCFFVASSKASSKARWINQRVLLVMHADLHVGERG